jgi:flagellar biosynthetic protein FliQ
MTSRSLYTSHLRVVLRTRRTACRPTRKYPPSDVAISYAIAIYREGALCLGRLKFLTTQEVQRDMTNDIAVGLISDLLKMALLLSLPLLLVILVVGLAISVLQVVTQVQDASIAFVPKLLLFGVAMAFLAPWMIGKLTAYAIATLSRVALL